MIMKQIAGVDEAGRGPLAGCVVAAAVILPKGHQLMVKDSKKLTAQRREVLFDEICRTAIAYAIGHANVHEIDTLNILQAAMLAMKRAVLALPIKPDSVQVDGNRCPELPYPCQAIVKGDDLIASISAASILAKVTRDREMLQLHEQYPQYDFARHKGYPTAKHLAALDKYGPSPEHRKSFKPVAIRMVEEFSV